MRYATTASRPTANWDFGYETYFPNVYIDNLQLMNAQTELQILANEKDSYTASNKFPYRSPLHESVHDPEALFTVYYTTKNQNLVEEKPNLVPFLEGFKKVDKDYTKLKNGEYTVVDNGDETYTGCTWISVKREDTIKGVSQVRVGVADKRTVLGIL